MKLRFDVALVVVACALLAVLAYSGEAMKTTHVSVASTYDTGPNGYRALYDALQSAGVPVSRFERSTAALDASTSTLIVTAYEGDPGARPLGGGDAARLRRYVADGGRLIAIDDDFAGADDITPGIGETHAARADGAITLARNRYTAGADTVRAPIDAVFPWRQQPGTPLLANDSGLVAIAYRFGRGEIVAVTAPAIFSNARLRNAGNVRFAYNLVAGNGSVAFDEYVHGYARDVPIWDVLPAPVRTAVWIVAAIVLLSLIGANVPFAPPVRIDPPAERDTSAYLAALGELVRNSRRRAPDAELIRSVSLELSARKENA